MFSNFNGKFRSDGSNPGVPPLARTLVPCLINFQILEISNSYLFVIDKKTYYIKFFHNLVFMGLEILLDTKIGTGSPF